MKRLMGLCPVLQMAAGVALWGGATALAQEPAAKPADAGPRVTWESNTCVHAQGEWTLRIQYLQKGSRSEGQDGVLLKNEQPVQPASDGEVIETALGQLKHYGTQRKVLWDNTGWNFADKKRIKLSGQVKASPTPEAK